MTDPIYPHANDPRKPEALRSASGLPIADGTLDGLRGLAEALGERTPPAAGPSMAYAVRGMYEIEGYYPVHTVVAVALDAAAAERRRDELTAYQQQRPQYPGSDDEAAYAAYRGWRGTHPLGPDGADYLRFDVEPLPLIA